MQLDWLSHNSNVSTILVLHGMVTTMLVQFLRFVDVPTLLEVQFFICSVWNPNVSTIFNLVGFCTQMGVQFFIWLFLYPNVSTIFHFVDFCTQKVQF